MRVRWYKERHAGMFVPDGGVLLTASGDAMPM